MASSNARLSSPSSMASPVAAALQTLFISIVSILDVLLRAREIHLSGQKMAALLREARHIEAKSPARAAALRNAAHRIARV
jgi:hypothetical protein